MRAPIVLIICLGLSGCATPYQEMGYIGGVSATQVTDTNFRISARGNSFTDPAIVQDYVMLKAAETAVEHGAKFFVVLSSADASRVATMTTPGTAQTTLVGSTAITSYSPPGQHEFYMPGQDIFIRLVAPGEKPPTGAVPAEEIIRHIGGRVKMASLKRG